MNFRILLCLGLFCLLGQPLLAKEAPFDGLKVLGTGVPLTDQQNNSVLTLRGFHDKYANPLVGLFIVQKGREVRFYMNPTTWDSLKQELIQARDQWATLSPTQFSSFDPLKGYRVGDHRANLSLGLMGTTKLDGRRVNISLLDQNQPPQIFISLDQSQVKTLVEQFHKVDEFLRGASTPQSK